MKKASLFGLIGTIVLMVKVVLVWVGADILRQRLDSGEFSYEVYRSFWDVVDIVSVILQIVGLLGISYFFLEMYRMYRGK